MISWAIFGDGSSHQKRLLDHWSEQYYARGADHEFFVLEPFSFCLMEWV